MMSRTPLCPQVTACHVDQCLTTAATAAQLLQNVSEGTCVWCILHPCHNIKHSPSPVTKHARTTGPTANKCRHVPRHRIKRLVGDTSDGVNGAHAHKARSLPTWKKPALTHAPALCAHGKAHTRGRSSACTNQCQCAQASVTDKCIAVEQLQGMVARRTHAHQGVCSW
jgi:hypothetical protein